MVAVTQFLCFKPDKPRHVLLTSGGLDFGMDADMPTG